MSCSETFNLQNLDAAAIHGSTCVSMKCSIYCLKNKRNVYTIQESMRAGKKIMISEAESKAAFPAVCMATDGVSGHDVEDFKQWKGAPYWYE